MIAILDYGAGNQTSVARACASLGIPVEITASARRLEEADGIIFPGVGAAGQAMARLRSGGLDKALASAAAAGKPVLGICLGCQILLEKSEEGDTPCLGILPGRARRFPSGLKDDDGSPVRIPHIGWNNVALTRPCPLFADIPANAEFYFVHGYYVETAPEVAAAVTRYGLEFCSVLGAGNIWAAQFHPEKSGAAGLKLLANFHAWSKNWNNNAVQTNNCLS